MATQNNDASDSQPDSPKDSALEKSFVGKFVSGFINSTPLSKWFKREAPGGVRPREEEEEDYVCQPPSKRPRMPEERNHASNNVAKVTRFPEPVAGPSGLKSRKLFEKHDTSSTVTISSGSFEAVNGDRDSDSAESSGYVSGAKKAPEKSTPKTRSLFTQSSDSSATRSLFSTSTSPQNTSLSSRRPAFNASTFGSPNFVDRTLSTKRIMESPFYNGRTIYGGASAYGRRLTKTSEEQKPASVQIKPVNDSISDNTTLSKTARRILSTLEQYSTPISDAKKIPVNPRKSGLLANYVGATPYLVKDRKRPSNKELQVPTVPDLLQMKQKERLQNSTESVRQMAAKSKSTLNNEEYKLRSEEKQSKMKMKSSVGSVRQKTQPLEPVVEVKLPKVSLPITTLPKFDFVMMPPTTTVAKTSTTIKETKETEKGGFVFSPPVVITKEKKAIAAINCFKFSEPDSQKKEAKAKNNGENLKESKKKDSQGFGDKFKLSSDKWECQSCLVRNNNLDAKCAACGTPKPEAKPACAPKPEVKSGFGDKFKPAASTWECASCLIRNKDELIKCAACGTSKVPPSTFGDKFKPSGDTWECTTCMIRNKNDSEKCAACETPKPGAKPKSSTSTLSTKFNFGVKTEWECQTCLIKNKNELTKCAACEMPKDDGVKSGFGDDFKLKSDQWECDSCLVKNKASSSQCVCCGVSKPGKPGEKPETKSEKISFNFGIDKANAAQIKFGIPIPTSTATTTSASTAPSEIKFGIPSTSASEIKFGVPTTSSEVKEIKFGLPPSDVKFGIPSSSSAITTSTTSIKFGVPSTGEIKFGIPQPDKPKEAPSTALTPPTKPTTTSAPTFTFGVAKATTTPTLTKPEVSTNPLLKPSEKLPEKASPAPAGFKFGVETPKTEAPKSESFTSFSPTFQFKPPAINGDISKAKEGAANVFGGDKPKESFFTSKTQESPFSKMSKAESPFGVTTSTSKESPFTSVSTSKESPFTSVSTSKESPFTSKAKESPFTSKATESPFTSKAKESPFTSKAAESPFTSKPVESPFTSKVTESPFTSKVTESPFTSKAKESPFTSKATESPFNTKPSESLFSTKSAESPFSKPFGTMTKTTNSPFGGTKPADSPFGTKPSESPFSQNESPFGKRKATDAPFGAPKPTESPFGGTPEVKKDSLFGGTDPKPLFNVDKPIFSMDKPKDIFGAKPQEGSGLFGAPTSTPSFSFSSKPLENPFGASQPSTAPVFKFGADAQPPPKKAFGESDANVSNGLGAPSKPTFGAPQPFSFGGGEAAPKPGGFSFGQSDKPNAPVFSFGNSTSSSGGFNFSVPSGGFSFGGAAPPPKVESQPFGAAPPKVESQPFGAPAGGNAFGAAPAKNGSFNFGNNANNNNQKAVFSFGSGQNQVGQAGFPAPGPSGFNFGNPGSLNAAPPGAFNFTGAPPSFNFTDGSGAQAQPPRKIKKALRRTHR